MPPKKSNRSPFGLFMVKMRRDDPNIRSMGMSQFVTYCQPLYDQLSAEVKTRFENLSCFVRNSGLDERQINKRLDNTSLTVEDNNNWDHQSGGDSLDQMITGFNLSIISNLRLDEQQKAFDDNLSEVDTFELLDNAFQINQNLKQTKIVCICFNILVHTFADEYFPNEIGLIEFTLEEGIKKFYTKLISNEVPEGYYAKAKEFSEKYHKLPVNSSDSEHFESDVTKIFDEIYDFMSDSSFKDQNNRKLVFCKTEERAGHSHRLQVIGCFKWFDQKIKSLGINSNKSLVNDFVIVELSDLLYLTAKEYGQTSPISQCCESLTRTKFDYYPNMRCGTHSFDDNNYCSLAIVMRSVYLFFDHLFSLKPGLQLDISPMPSNTPSKVENDSFVAQMNISVKSSTNTRSMDRLSVEQQESDSVDQQNEAPVVAKVGVTPLDRSQQIGIGRGRKMKLLLESRKLNQN